MLGRPLSTGQVSARGFIIGRSQSALWFVAYSHSAAHRYAADKPPSRDFGTDVEIPPVNPVACALMRVIF